VDFGVFSVLGVFGVLGVLGVLRVFGVFVLVLVDSVTSLGVDEGTSAIVPRDVLVLISLSLRLLSPSLRYLFPL
jgi:hypothetical protein